MITAAAIWVAYAEYIHFILFAIIPDKKIVATN
jgi:hypothetical protein